MESIENRNLLQYLLKKKYIQSIILLENHLNFKPIDVYAVGAYHGLNVGDMSMGIAIKNIAQSLRINIRFVNVNDISNFNPKSKTKYIFGGGAIFSPQNLIYLIQKTDNDPSKVGVLGVDLHLNHNAETISYLSKSVFIGSRFSATEEQKEIFRAGLSRNDILWHPDLTFSFYPLSKTKSTSKNLKTSTIKKIGLNIFPFFFSRYGKRWEVTTYDQNPYDPPVKLAKLDQQMIGQKYIELMRSIAQKYISAGFSVCHIPFALADDLFAKSVLSGLNVDFYPFTANPYKVFDRMKDLHLFIPTRLHAHIFSTILQIPFFSISYGAKCKSLLNLLNVPDVCSINYDELLNSSKFDRALQSSISSTFICKDSQLLELSNQSKSAIKDAVIKLTS